MFENLNQKTKAKLRAELKHIRSSLSSDFKAETSSIIYQNVVKMERWQQSKVIHIYVSLRDEVCTEQIIQQAILQGKIVICPRQKPNNILENFVVKTAADVAKIRDGNVANLDLWSAKLEDERSGKIDLILLPLLAFDENGNRLGFGSGWYDTFCAKHGSATKIGLAFLAQKVQQIASEKHDVKLDAVVTEAGLRPIGY